MDPKKAKKRVTEIEKMQAELEKRVVVMDDTLFLVIVASAAELLDSNDPQVLERLLINFQEVYHFPIVTQLVIDIENVIDLAGDYFKGAPVNEQIFQAVNDRVRLFIRNQLGIDRVPNSAMLRDGFLRSFYEATPVKQAIRQVHFNAKASGIGLTEFKREMRQLVKGVETANGQSLGLMGQYYDTFAYDLYQKADSAAQDQFADELGMTAAIYTGGLIRTSRPFCVARNGKVFLKSEIKKFGTPQDKYGGYSDKSRGLFAGKNKGYNPLIDRGGYRCRHSYSYIADEEAMRMRNDLILKNGKLTTKNA